MCYPFLDIRLSVFDFYCKQLIIVPKSHVKTLLYDYKRLFRDDAFDSASVSLRRFTIKPNLHKRAR